MIIAWLTRNDQLIHGRKTKQMSNTKKTQYEQIVWFNKVKPVMDAILDLYIFNLYCLNIKSILSY
ncbi:hypothetical protein D479_14282 [Halobacillus sp. BAB-2008]|nr:hypothetical protein D479_14282 [Halobacillus sp. BAB-2008]